MKQNKKSMAKPPALRGLAGNRTSSKKVRFLSVLADNCMLNAAALIQRAKESAAFGPVPWDEASWNVSASETPRGHKQRDANLHFTQHRAGHEKGRTVGSPFTNQNGFSDLVKAIIRLRREIGGQNATNQSEVLIAFRYVYGELDHVGYDLQMLTPSHLDSAARRVIEKETEVSAYKRLEKLEEIARLLNDNGLVRAQLTWRCGYKRRPDTLRGTRLAIPEEQQANRSKLPKDGIIEAVANLYHLIPKDEWADRVRICLVSLLVITGFRIGELLTLPARRVETEEHTGHRYIVYHPEKGSPPQKKWLMTVGGELAEAMIDELLALTAEPRAMAAWLHEHPGEVSIDGIDWAAELMPIGKVAKAIGLKRGFSQFYKVRNIELLGEGKNLVVRSNELREVLCEETYSRPINVVKNTGEALHLKDALTCSFRNAFHKTRAALRYAVAPISEQQLSDFIGSRGQVKSAFERYGIKGSDESQLKVASHAFRHWLNDLLDRGGLTDVEQAVYFGRRNPADNRAYQHMTPKEKTLKARQDLQEGYLLGPVADVIKRLPVDRQSIVLQARVQAVHVVPGGVCFHQFSQSPCPNHMACTDGCGDFHWQTNDAIEVKELRYQESVLKVAVESSKLEVDEGSWGADSWLDHNVRKLEQVQRCLQDCDQPVKDGAGG